MWEEREERAVRCRIHLERTSRRPRLKMVSSFSLREEEEERLTDEEEEEEAHRQRR